MSDILSPLIDAEYARSVLRYDPETGLLHWLKSGPGRKLSLVAGTRNKLGYWVTSIQHHLYANHRLAMLLTHGRWPEHEVDHINGIRDDNRLVNLREVSKSVNMQNRASAQSNSRTGLLGASRARGRNGYASYIHIDGKNIRLGTYETAEAAHKAHLEARRKHYQGNTL